MELIYVRPQKMCESVSVVHEPDNEVGQVRSTETVHYTKHDLSIFFDRERIEVFGEQTDTALSDQWAEVGHSSS